MTEAEILSTLDGTDLNACPGCAKDGASKVCRLGRCSRCKISVCLREDCKVWKLDQPRRCSVHTYMVVCASCPSDKPSPLMPCPIDACKNFMCPACQKKSPGELVGAIKTAAAAHNTRSSKKQKLDPQPRHPPRTAPCSSCCRELKWKVCDDTKRCWSKGQVVCPDCSPEGGKTCTMGHSAWRCDSCCCLPTSPDLLIRECPSCKESFCPQCKALRRCTGCKKSERCKFCKDKDKRVLSGGGLAQPQQEIDISKDRGVTLRSACSAPGCNHKLCKSCLKQPRRRCGGCSLPHCRNHFEDHCGDCGKGLCENCAFDECECGGRGEMALDVEEQEISLFGRKRSRYNYY